MRDFVDGFDEDGAASAQLFDNIRIMNDFVMNVDRRPISL
jgi:hypothetical protein